MDRMVDHIHEQPDRRSHSVGFSTLSVRSIMNEVEGPPEVFDQPQSGIYVECRGPVEAEMLSWDRAIQTCLTCLTRREREALQRDLDLAAQVQRQMLPPQNLRTGPWEIGHYYRPSGVASGDICDVIRNGEDLGILIGDVSGKGVAASLLAANLQGLFRTLLPDGKDLASSLARANRIFNASTAISQYATLVCLEASVSGEIGIANAGHCIPYLIRPEGIAPIPTSGFPLGVFPESSYEVGRFRLEAGEAIFAYTDGLSEARNADGEEYGVTRITECLQASRRLPAKELVRACLADLANFLGTTRLADDLTVMLIRRIDA